VTNSVRHAGITPIDVVRVGVELAPDALRLEVTDPGSHGAIAPRTPTAHATEIAAFTCRRILERSTIS
jgi:anti-sigma regulatory factor (Ser/Thr protein kinase)